MITPTHPSLNSPWSYVTQGTHLDILFYFVPVPLTVWMAKLQHFLEPVLTEQHDSKRKETKLQVYCKAEAIMKYTFKFQM